MPLAEGLYGLNKDGSANGDYCKMCFSNGTFTEMKLTLEQMLDRSVAYMISEMKFSPERAREFAHTVIPDLKRWRK